VRFTRVRRPAARLAVAVASARLSRFLMAAPSPRGALASPTRAPGKVKVQRAKCQ
jgi:hypothetical protein